MGVFYFFVVAIWSFGIKFHGAPDESTHFFLLEYLNAFHSLPDATQPSQPFTGAISGYTWQPGAFWYHGLPFPHVLGALISYHSLGWILPNELGYVAARCVNWIMGAIFIGALFRIGYRAGMSKRAAALGALIVALIPQVSFVFSYFNSDAYGLMSVALVLSALLGFLKRPDKLAALCLGGALGLMFMAKLYFLPALVFVAVTLVAQHYFAELNLKKCIVPLIVAAAIVSGPMLLLTYMKFGEISGVSGQIEFSAMHKGSPSAGYGTCFIGCPEHFFEMKAIRPWLSLSLVSYFSVTGWMSIYLPPTYYSIAAALFAALCIAAAVQTYRARAHVKTSVFYLNYLLPLIMIFGLFPSIVVLSMLASQNALPQPQGRYLFVTIPFLSILIALATKSYFSAAVASSTAKVRHFHVKCLVTVAVWMAWTNSLAWSANTLDPTNIGQSAIGMAVTDAVMASDAAKTSETKILSPAQLTSRLALNNGEFFLKATVEPKGTVGNLDEIRKTPNGWLVKGWSFIEEADGAPQYVIAVEAGKVVSALRIDNKRPDVAAALNNKAAARSGYDGNILSTSSSDRCDLKLYTVSSTFKIFAMPDVCASISRSSN
nr:glycosyltransferase family 39 protein [Pseudomonas cannabina]